MNLKLVGIILILLCVFVFLRRSRNVIDQTKSIDFDPDRRIITIIDADMLFDAAINSNWLVDILYEDGSYEQRFLRQDIQLNPIFDSISVSSITAFNRTTKDYRRITIGKAELIDCDLARSIKVGNKIYLEVIGASDLLSITGENIMKKPCINLFGSPSTAWYLDVGNNQAISCVQSNIFFSIILDKGKVVSVQTKINRQQNLTNNRSFAEQCTQYDDTDYQNNVNYNFVPNYEFNPTNYSFDNPVNYALNNHAKILTSEKGMMQLLGQEIQVPNNYVMKLIYENRVVIMESMSAFIDLNNLICISLWNENYVLDQLNISEKIVVFYKTDFFKICFELDGIAYLYLPQDFNPIDTEIYTQAYVEEYGNLIECSLVKLPHGITKFIANQYGQSYLIQVAHKQNDITATLEPILTSPCGLINLSPVDNSVRIVPNNNVNVANLKFRAIFTDASSSERIGNNVRDLVSIFPHKTLVAIYATTNESHALQFDSNPLSCFEAIPGSHLIVNPYRDCFILDQNLYLESKGVQFAHASVKIDLSFVTTSIFKTTIVQNNIQNVTVNLGYYKIYLPEPRGTVIVSGTDGKNIIKVEVNLDVGNYAEST